MAGLKGFCAHPEYVPFHDKGRSLSGWVSYFWEHISHKDWSHFSNVSSLRHNDFRDRTVEQDAAFGIRQIVDVALKALSPGIIDTTTAVTCVDFSDVDSGADSDSANPLIAPLRGRGTARDRQRSEL